MKISFLNQTKRFPEHLNKLKEAQVMPYDRNLLVEKNSFIEIEEISKLSQLNTAAFFDYRIFPEQILSAYAQWTDEKRKIQIGDTIVQQVFLPPFPVFSQKAIFGVRIQELINESNRIGFSYETLEGHVEKGISYFLLEETDNRVVFRIRTFSKPGNFLSKLLGPLFSIPYQTYCTRKALENVKQDLQKSVLPIAE
ncbi:hypothetical protein D3C71_579680 [compost metagenome]